jgi:hypothetical protein
MPQLSDVKTGQGRRTIDLDSRTVAVVRAWKRRQLEERVLTNLRPDTGLVFAHPRRLLHPSRLPEPDLRPSCGEIDPLYDSPPRSQTYPRFNPSEARGSAQGRKRAIRSRQPRVHPVCLPARAPRNASRRGQCILSRDLRINLNPLSLLITSPEGPTSTKPSLPARQRPLNRGLRLSSSLTSSGPPSVSRRVDAVGRKAGPLGCPGQGGSPCQFCAEPTD